MSLCHGFDASAYEFFDGLSCIDVNDRPGHPNHKVMYGFVDREGIMRIPPIYEAAEDFRGGLAAVKLNGKWGFIDTKGETIIPLVYDLAHEFSDGLALVELNGKYGSIDIKGDIIIPVIYDSKYSFMDGRALVRLNGQYGYIDAKGDNAPMSSSETERYLREGME